MTQEDVIKMAREADLDWHTGWTLDDEAPNRFETFAKLVTAHEREACAKVCEQMDSISEYYGERVELICATAIRSRGEQT